MGFFDSIGGAISSGLDYLGSTAANVWQGIGDAWMDTGPSAAGPGGGWARRLGTQVGDIAESVAGGFVAQAIPMPGGGLTGAGPIDPWGPQGINPRGSSQNTLRQAEIGAATRNEGIRLALRNTQGEGLSQQAPIDQPVTGYNYQPRPDQIVGAGLPAIIGGAALGDLAARGAEYALSEPGQQMIGNLWDLVRGRTATPGGAPVDSRMDVDPETGEERLYPLQFERQGPMLPSTISAPLPFGGRLFKQTYSGVRANSIVMVRHPQTQAPVFFRHVGRPILFSGDFATARRVDKIAKKARKSRRGR